jgi:hypothetical protein
MARHYAGADGLIGCFLPVHTTLCGGLAAERHEWVTTMCATAALSSWRIAALDFWRHGKGVQGFCARANKRPAGGKDLPKARCTFGAPLAWLFLAGLRPRRARLRFTKHRYYTDGTPRHAKNPQFGALTRGRLWVTPKSRGQALAANYSGCRPPARRAIAECPRPPREDVRGCRGQGRRLDSDSRRFRLKPVLRARRRRTRPTGGVANPPRQEADLKNMGFPASAKKGPENIFKSLRGLDLGRAGDGFLKNSWIFAGRENRIYM